MISPTWTNGVYEFLKNPDADDGKRHYPTFADALQTDKVCAAVLKSGKDKQWHDV